MDSWYPYFYQPVEIFNATNLFFLLKIMKRAYIWTIIVVFDAFYMHISHCLTIMEGLAFYWPIFILHCRNSICMHTQNDCVCAVCMQTFPGLKAKKMLSFLQFILVPDPFIFIYISVGPLGQRIVCYRVH